jgi:CDP-diacylglycerol---glycerol-3-phosphate 3-phosphatidyltransferase
MPVEGSATPGVVNPSPSLWNLPNGLTVLRILLVPVLGWLLLHDGGADNAVRVWAFAVFFVAILTDRYDGDIARRRNLVTDFGKIMDPIADKALTGMAFIGLSLIDELWWWVTIVVLFREALITALRFWVIRIGVIAASQGGKLKTVAQTLALGLFIAPLRHLHGGWDTIGEIGWWIGVAAMAAAFAFTVVTGVQYVVAMLASRREAKAAKAA